MLRIHLLLQEAGSSLRPPTPIQQGHLILRALTMQMQIALDSKNLGRWAEVMQVRTRYLPFDKHPPLAMARRLSHAHHWFVAVTPPQFVIYLIYNVWWQVVYVGVTSSALTSRLRKHMTDSLADVDCATLHKYMLKHGLGGWGILPLQWVEEEWLASVRERHWWWVFRRWACNDVAPGISTEGEGSQSRGWMNQRVLAALKGIKDARHVDDYPRIKFLQNELRELAARLSIPLYVLAHVTVPNLTPDQSAAIHRLIRKLVQSCKVPAWEKQALLKALRVVRSNPMTVKRVFDKQCKQFDCAPSQPPCMCSNLADHPSCRIIEGHVALIPVTLRDMKSQPLRPNDSLPLTGSKVRTKLFRDLEQIAKQINATLPNLHEALPPTLWPENGSLYRHVQTEAKHISSSHYVRIVDKGVGVMWGFCKHWMWSVLMEFLQKEKYVQCHESAASVQQRVSDLVMARDWQKNPMGKLALLYLIGRAKSLYKPDWLWRPIAALPQPLLPKKELKIAARATTCMLRLLSKEVPGNIMVHSVNSVAAWFQWLPSIGCSYLVELDCKDQFNHVPPSQVLSHLKGATDWLAKRRRWRMQDIVWSVHRESKRLDRAGQGKSSKFWYITQQRLMDTIEFELVNNNYVVAGGDVWQRPGCIPMGGSFSPQSADLHCQWGVYKHRHLFRRLGQLHIGDSGFAYWDTPWGVLSLCQFRDNVLMATSFPDSPDIGIVAHIRSLLHTAWNLRVLCPCDDNCTHTCLQSHMTAMGYTMVCSDTHPHTAFVHPSSLTDAWAIKLGPPLVSPSSAYPKYLSGIFTGVLSNAVVWCTTPLSIMLSVAAWCQVASLSDYTHRHIRRAMTSAIVRSTATSPHDATKVVAYLNHILPLIPMPKCCHITRAVKWVRRHCFWSGDRYATWRLPEGLCIQGVSGDWSSDHHTLQSYLSQIVEPCVCVTVRLRAVVQTKGP